MRPLFVRSALVLLTLIFPSRAFGIPGPATTVVVANGNLAESIDLARRYVRARDVPERQLCLLDLPDAETISFDEYLVRFDAPFETCLGGVRERIEAVVLVRGVPLRVSIADRGEGAQRASLAAVVGARRSEVTSDGSRLIESFSPGRRTQCGNTPCLAARWSNPYRNRRFGPGWSAERDGVIHRPILVTMLHGRSFLDASRLVASATVAESSTVALAMRNRRFMLMEGSDRARGVLDVEFTSIRFQLVNRGFNPIQVAHNRNRRGEALAAFVVGTARLGDTIEGNSFRPGSLVDNLTSFGAVPENFRPSGEERQVSIARWVAQGVAGVHGTTDEPLNNSFPSRRFLLDWADGWTLAESFHRNLPFVYWRNLVLGDPMAAAWATRPSVVIEGVEDGDRVEGSQRLRISAEPSGEIQDLVLYVDGIQIDRTSGSELRLCAPVPEGADVQLLAVAETVALRNEAAKGWRAVRVEGAPGPSDCPTPDAGLADAPTAVDAPSFPDAGPADASQSRPMLESPEDGCRCVQPRTASEPLFLVVAALIAGLGAGSRRPKRR